MKRIEQGTKTSIYLSKKDLETLMEWKEGRGYSSVSDVIRYAISKLGTPANIPQQGIKKESRGDSEVIYD